MCTRSFRKYHDQAWVGHLRNDFRTITVDLGEVRPIQEIRANFMQEMSTGIYYPVEVMAEVSADGVLWTEVGLQRFNRVSMGTEDFIKPVIFDELDENARYVRITFLVDVWVSSTKSRFWANNAPCRARTAARPHSRRKVRAGAVLLP